ncbi:MAG: hypothetical protein K6E30_09205 [Lachnospiraceae bacterium]|nr:hypothetical protein [Lachnospiraceae bacterium]
MYYQSDLAAKRGDILDTNGNVLALSVRMYKLILDPELVNQEVKEDGKIIQPYRAPVLEALKTVYGIEESTLLAILDDEKYESSNYYVLLSGKTLTASERKKYEDYREDIQKAIEALEAEKQSLNDGKNGSSSGDEAIKILKEKLKYTAGIFFEDVYDREYPYRTLASEVIGFTGSDGADLGYGIESYYNGELSGTDGRRYSYWSEASSDYIRRDIIEPTNGKTVVSSIDINIERMVQAEIDRFMEEYDAFYEDRKAAANVGVIVMNPSNGQVLAMASNDSFDLNDPQSSASTAEERAEIFRNYCISSGYEPGSVVKPVTAAGALDAGKISEKDTFLCDGFETIQKTKISCSKASGHGLLSLKEVLSNSCNDGIMQIAAKLGAEDFAECQRNFGFGSKTGIDLSGEEAGILFEAEKLGALELATSSFGQGWTCTMIQEAAAVSTIANGGSFYRPCVVREIRDEDGSVLSSKDGILEKKTVSKDTAEIIRSAMKEAVENGTAQYAKVNGYSMGGKTGTAEKLPRGNSKYLVSFIGFVPYENPEVLIYTVIDEPNLKKQDDSRFPQWISRNILSQVLPYLGIDADEELEEENVYLRSDIDNTEGIAS